MAAADVGKHHGLRAGDFRQAVHLSEVVDSHFQDGKLIFRRQPENSQRHAQLVVKVSFCFQNPIPAGEHGSRKLFRAGFSDASHNSHNRNRQLPQVKRGDLLDGLQCGGYQNRLCSGKVQALPVLHQGDSACLTDLSHKMMAVHTFSFDRGKQAVPLRFPAVGDNRGHLQILFFFQTVTNAACYSGNIFYRQIFHFLKALLPFVFSQRNV